jgi:hypothetical protein
MPIRSRGDVPAGTIRDLGLPGRAVSALTRAGITRTDALARLTRRELAAVPGLGPGLIAAIRLVVPEPATRAARSGVSPDAGDGQRAVPGTDPEPGPVRGEKPAAPVMPSFDSLRGTRRRSAVDLLLPGELPEQQPEPPAGEPADAGVPRPPDYADLLLLGVRGARAVADVSLRVTRWWLRDPVHCLMRLLDDPAGPLRAARGDPPPERS